MIRNRDQCLKGFRLFSTASIPQLILFFYDFMSPKIALHFEIFFMFDLCQIAQFTKLLCILGTKAILHILQQLSSLSTELAGL